MIWIYLATGLAAYLIGAIPFGYLIYYALTKQDVREVGSGNIGATNVGRLLGFRFFVLVFVLDLLKGFLPTVGLPWMLARLGWHVPSELAVLAAIGSIFGHNFPVYLGFKGGKGVATSLGALLALDPVACGFAAAAFFAVFLTTRYVSLSSMTGGLAFAAAYFLRTAGAWDREHRAMSILVIVVVCLLIVRHRKNVGRLMAGTESRVNFGRRKPDAPPSQPTGMVRPVVVAVLAAGTATTGLGAWVYRRAQDPVEVIAGPWLMRETHREATGQQRATHVAFDEGGEHLAVLCPRYNRILTYQIDPEARLKLLAQIDLDGRPVSLAIVGGNVAVLQRPVNDAKHLGPGWLDLFSFEGARKSDHVPAGYYPDDLAATPDGNHLIVLASGRAEGDAWKHAPELSVFATSDVAARIDAKPVGRLAFDDGDDLERLTLSRKGGRALLTLARTQSAVAVDLTHPESPTLAGRIDLQKAEVPTISRSADGDCIQIPSNDRRAAVGVASKPTGSTTDAPGYLVVSRPEDSRLDLVQVEPPTLLGRFPILGPLNLSGAEVSSLAYCEKRALVAAATKPGTVHLVRLESRLLAPNAVPPARPGFAGR